LKMVWLARRDTSVDHLAKSRILPNVPCQLS
jgi:hypothetical protein